MFGIQVLDPDGWRGPGGRSWDDPIDLEEYHIRVSQSTVKETKPGAFDDLIATVRVLG
jgi:hypothetical protein